MSFFNQKMHKNLALEYYFCKFAEPKEIYKPKTDLTNHITFQY